MSETNDNPLTDQEEMAAVTEEINAEGAEEAKAAAEEETARVEAKSVETAEFVGDLLRPAAAILAPNWNLQEEEIEALSVSYAAVLDKYYPDVVGEAGPEVTALLVTVTVFGSRQGVPRRVEKVVTEAEVVDGENT